MNLFLSLCKATYTNR